MRCVRSAIIRRLEFLANAMAEEDMNLEETYSSWHAVCVLPALEGYESDEFDDESEDESTGPSISKRQKTSNAKMKKENAALKADVKRERKVKINAATGAVPYAAKSETWFAFSNFSRGTRLGTDASLAGDQNRVMHSTKIIAV